MCGTLPLPTHAPPPQPPLLGCSKTFFLLSCLGEKRGVPFHAKQGVVRARGASGACIFAYSHLVPSVFCLLSAIFFVSLIGLTDHELFHLEGWGKGAGGGLSRRGPWESIRRQSGENDEGEKSSKLDVSAKKRGAGMRRARRMLTWKCRKSPPLGSQMVT